MTAEAPYLKRPAVIECDRPPPQMRFSRGLLGERRGANLTDKRKQSRRRTGRNRMDRRVGDRRAEGVPPAPDTPAKRDTARRVRSTDSPPSSPTKPPKPVPKSSRKSR